jgi:hypothetical protein
MKKLTYFLWFLVGIASAFFAYHTYTHTRLRYKDLESVMMQNLAVENKIESVRRHTQKQLKECEELTVEIGNVPKDRAIVNKAKMVKNYVDSVLKKIDTLTFIENGNKNSNKVSLHTENIPLLNSINTTFPEFVSKQDTSLIELNNAMTLIKWDNATCLLPFINKQKLGIKSIAARIERKGVEKLTSKVASMWCGFTKIFGMASEKNQVISIGEVYEAQMFITKNAIQIKPYMQISEGTVKVRGDAGYIEIPNVKAQNYNSEGKATKTLTGKITIKKADGSDTTFTLSTSYTVKKK